MATARKSTAISLAIFGCACLLGLFNQGGGCERLILIPIYVIFGGSSSSDDDPEPVPAAEVTNLKAVPRNHAVYLSWSPPYGQSGFEVRRGDTAFPQDPGSDVFVYSGNGNSILDTGLLPGVEYYYSVFSRNSENEYSAPVSVSAIPISLSSQGWIGSGLDGWQTGSSPLAGLDDRSFWAPSSVAVDRDLNIYVADSDNHRVCKWDAAGNFAGWLGGAADGWQTGLAPASGADFQSFNRPRGVCVDPGTGAIYVADSGNHRICKWNPDGSAAGCIGGGASGWQTSAAPLNAGSDLDSFDSPAGVFFKYGIYVADTGNNRVCRWSSDGTAEYWIGGGQHCDRTDSGAAAGQGDTSFDSPSGAAADDSYLYVADTGNNRVCRWSLLSRNAYGWIGGGLDYWQTGPGCAAGGDHLSFNAPRGVALDVCDNLYVSDSGNHRIVKRTNSGYSYGWIGAGAAEWSADPVPPLAGSTATAFSAPAGIAFDLENNLLVADSGNHRISWWKE